MYKNILNESLQEIINWKKMYPKTMEKNTRMGNVGECYSRAVKGIDENLLESMNEWYSYVNDLPTKENMVYTVVVFHNQVFNGGLHQYFFNGYGIFAYITLNNLRTLNACKAAGVLERAIDEVNIDKFNDYEFRERIFNRTLVRISKFDKELKTYLNSLDSEYYKIEHEDIEELLNNFLINTNDDN